MVGEAKLAFGPGDASRAPKSAPAVIVLTGQQNFRLFSKSAPDAMSHYNTILPSIRSSADEKSPKPGTASLLGARAVPGLRTPPQW